MENAFDKNEAFLRMKKGQKVTHDSMNPSEFIYSIDKDCKIVDQDGNSYSHEFWMRNTAYYEYGWSVYAD